MDGVLGTGKYSRHESVSLVGCTEIITASTPHVKCVPAFYSWYHSISNGKKCQYNEDKILYFNTNSPHQSLNITVTTCYMSNIK